MRQMHLALAVIGAGLLLAGPGGADDWSKWKSAYDPRTRTRFIPVELWTGGEWDGERVIRMPKADLVFGRRGEKSVRGPVEWRRPGTGELVQVYERLNRGKRQLFTLTNDGTGLGRVFDSRYRDYDCADEVKFPLGYWTQDETRTYTVRCKGGTWMRSLRLTIEEIDYEYQRTPHSLRFHWLLDEGRGRATDMTYIYSPLKGLVHVEGNE